MPLEVWPLKNRGLSLLISSSKLSLYRHYALFRTKELSCAYMWAVRILEDWGHSSFIKWHWYFLLLLWHHNHVLQFPLWLGGEVWGGHVHLPCVWCGSETCPWVPQGVSTICNKPDVSGANLPAVTVSFLIFCTFPPPPPLLPYCILNIHSFKRWGMLQVQAVGQCSLCPQKNRQEPSSIQWHLGQQDRAA